MTGRSKGGPETVSKNEAKTHRRTAKGKESHVDSVADKPVAGRKGNQLQVNSLNLY